MKYGYDRNEKELELIGKECAELHDGKHYLVTGLGYVTKEWAKLFLTNWNRAVSVWNNGELFTDKEWPSKSVSQQYYARLCCTWMLPNGMVEPHCVAEGG